MNDRERFHDMMGEQYEPPGYRAGCLLSIAIAVIVILFEAMVFIDALSGKVGK